MTQSILVVDDFVEYSNLLQKKLKSEGYAVLSAADAEEGLRVAREKKPDLIVMDIMMPGMGGTEARAELLKDPSTKDIPLIYLTGLRSPHSKKKLTEGVKTIGKSNDIRELVEAIREMLGKKS